MLWSQKTKQIYARKALKRLEQHQLNIHIQLDKIKEEIINIKLLRKVEDPYLLQHQFP